MKSFKPLLLIVPFLAACGTPATPTQTATPVPPTNTLPVSGTPTQTVTPDPAMGSIEGKFSWLISSTSASLPIAGVNLEINGHTGDYARYAASVDQNGHFKFYNVEPSNYGFGIYLNLQNRERQCEAPEYIYGTDLKWVHYSTWLKVDVYYDVLFSSVDVTVNPAEVVVLDFTLKCP